MGGTQTRKHATGYRPRHTPEQQSKSHSETTSQRESKTPGEANTRTENKDQGGKEGGKKGIGPREPGARRRQRTGEGAGGGARHRGQGGAGIGQGPGWLCSQRCCRAATALGSWGLCVEGSGVNQSGKVNAEDRRVG